MSRVAKVPVTIPADVKIVLGVNEIEVNGPLGTLRARLHSSVMVTHEGNKLYVVGKDGVERAGAMSGTIRANIANMVQGVSKGFERKLTLVGVGYRAQAQGNKLNLSLGFSHPVFHEMPSGVKVETPSPTEIILKGVDRQRIGQVAAEIRSYRPPEPYKGKGVRYSDEIVAIKETKKK